MRVYHTSPPLVPYRTDTKCISWVLHRTKTNSNNCSKTCRNRRLLSWISLATRHRRFWSLPTTSKCSNPFGRPAYCPDTPDIHRGLVLALLSLGLLPPRKEQRLAK